MATSPLGTLPPAPKLETADAKDVEIRWPHSTAPLSKLPLLSREPKEAAEPIFAFLYVPLCSPCVAVCLFPVPRLVASEL